MNDRRNFSSNDDDEAAVLQSDVTLSLTKCCRARGSTAHMQHEGSYLYRGKRRRIELVGLQTSWPERRRLYEQAWKEQKEKIDVRRSFLVSLRRRPSVPH